MSRLRPLYLFFILLTSLFLQAFTLPQKADIPAPLLTAPSGTITARRPAYQWQPVSGATSYSLTVYMVDRGMTFLKVTVSASACNSTSCTYRPSATLLNGNYRFRVAAKVGSNCRVR